MDHELFYEISRQLNSSSLPNKYDYHIVRYKHFVDASRKRHNCIYAEKTRDMFISTKEREKLIPILISLDMLDIAILLNEVY